MNKFNCHNDTSVEEFLKSFYLSKANIKTLLDSNYYINGSPSISKTLRRGDVIEFDLSLLDKSYFDHYKYKIDIVYEDDYLLIINKPIKMLVHPDGNRNDTLANAVSFYYSITNQEISVRVTHRLDYDTSGLIVFSKDALTHSYLNYQIENNIFKKEYIAIVEGFLEKTSATIDYPIGRNRHDSKKYLVSKTGKRSITKYEVLSRTKSKSKVKVIIDTGRTHQIRVHFAYINHPIIGDELYGKQADRMYLHASRICFIHPNTRNEITLTSKISGGDKWKV